METFFWYLIATIVISIVFAPATPAGPPPATMDDFEFPQADEGTPQIVVFGDVWLSGWTVLSYGNLRTEAITKSGGKK